METEPTVAEARELEHIFREHHARVIQAAFRITGCREDAEDVAQTVFLRLARQRHLGGVDNVGSYLHRAAVNAALDVVRSRQTSKPVALADVEDVLPSKTVSPERDYAAAEIRNWMRQALGRLSPRSAEVFALRYLEDYTNREIAKITGSSEIMVGVTLHRARRLLKKDFERFTRSRQ